MRKAIELIGFSLLTAFLFLGLANIPSNGNGKGEVKLVFSSSTHGYFDPCG
ncbi:MAG: hypothetical protein ACE5I1_18390 [bacterium]